jgi:hypothetical protein
VARIGLFIAMWRLMGNGLAWVVIGSLLLPFNL